MSRPRRRRSIAAAALAAIGAGALAAPGLAAKGDLDLISRATGPAGAPVDANAIVPSISANGARVAFDTDADNISAEDNNAVRNIFVRDASTSETIFVSRVTGAAGAAADGLSRNPAISADGRYVAFESAADNLSGEDNNAFT
ncbi:MAG: hypothetical protein K2X91_09445, partial [Thermoleophilia bacterium]|nr:hypothetical protein [Thermoleophilia bacterium]